MESGARRWLSTREPEEPLLITRRAFVDRTYGMPFVALCPDLAYEFTHGFVEPSVPPLDLFDIAWFLGRACGCPWLPGGAYSLACG